MPSMHGYSDIINYFEHLATTSADFQHQPGTKIAFIASDISDFQALENIPKFSSPFMIAGYNPEDFDAGREVYTISDDNRDNRMYNINIAIFKEVASINAHGGIKAERIALDEIVDRVMEKVTTDRADAIQNCVPSSDDCCFFKFMDLEVPIYKTQSIGTRQAIGYILNFNFNFKR